METAMPHTRRTFLASLGAGGVVPPALFQTISSRERYPALGLRMGDQPLAYLDNAATTLRPREARAACVADCVASGSHHERR
jgi:selenocysteine lyase/cysteine desulfurase